MLRSSSYKPVSIIRRDGDALDLDRVPGPRNMNLEDSIQFYHHAQVSQGMGFPKHCGAGS